MISEDKKLSCDGISDFCSDIYKFNDFEFVYENKKVEVTESACLVQSGFSPLQHHDLNAHFWEVETLKDICINLKPIHYVDANI